MRAIHLSLPNVPTRPIRLLVEDTYTEELASNENISSEDEGNKKSK